MTSQEIIRSLAKQSGQRSYWNTFSRYIVILNNHLQNRPLSKIEVKNHQGNNPRKYYLDLLVRGFNLEIDYNSPNFENRLDINHKKYGWSDDTIFYERFFKRLEFFRKTNLSINPKTLSEMVSDGNVMFKYNYKFEDETK